MGRLSQVLGLKGDYRYMQLLKATHPKAKVWSQQLQVRYWPAHGDLHLLKTRSNFTFRSCQTESGVLIQGHNPLFFLFLKIYTLP